MTRPPMDLETVTARHCAQHVAQAVQDLEKALAPLQSNTMCRDSALARNLRAALKEAKLANGAARLWSEDKRVQQGDLLEEGGAHV